MASSRQEYAYAPVEIALVDREGDEERVGEHTELDTSHRASFCKCMAIFAIVMLVVVLCIYITAILKSQLDAQVIELKSVESQLDAQMVELKSVESQLDAQMVELKSVESQSDAQMVVLKSIEEELNAEKHDKNLRSKITRQAIDCCSTDGSHLGWAQAVLNSENGSLWRKYQYKTVEHLQSAQNSSTDEGSPLKVINVCTEHNSTWATGFDPRVMRTEQTAVLDKCYIHEGWRPKNCSTTRVLNGSFFVFVHNRWPNTGYPRNIWHFMQDFAVPLLQGLASLPDPNSANLQVVLADTSMGLGGPEEALLDHQENFYDYQRWWLNSIFPNFMPNLSFTRIGAQEPNECVHFADSVSYVTHSCANGYDDNKVECLNAWDAARGHIHRMLSLPTALPRPSLCTDGCSLKVLIIQRGTRGFQNLEREIDAMNFGFMYSSVEVAIVDLAKLSPADQIAVVYSSDITIGSHGAGLSNILLQKPGTASVQVLAAQHCNTGWARAFMNYALVGNLDHSNYCTPVKHVRLTMSNAGTMPEEQFEADMQAIADHTYENSYDDLKQQQFLYAIHSYMLSGMEISGIVAGAKNRVVSIACKKELDLFRDLMAPSSHTPL